LAVCACTTCDAIVTAAAVDGVIPCACINGVIAFAKVKIIIAARTCDAVAVVGEGNVFNLAKGRCIRTNSNCAAFNISRAIGRQINSRTRAQRSQIKDVNVRITAVFATFDTVVAKPIFKRDGIVTSLAINCVVANSTVDQIITTNDVIIWCPCTVG